ncbi:MAG: hypothetical protein HOV81_12420 [Kofleriaceae bacterium]|nr:hypothetical protein [Kofleriaceae bacterium]
MRIWVAVLLCLSSAAHADDGTDFTAQAKAMFRIAACGSDDAIPRRLSARAIDAHCDRMKWIYGQFKKTWIDDAKPYIAKLRPDDLPSVVVYPFGGGDLSSALTVFPDATELTTLSLEAPGDIRAIDTIDAKRLGADLKAISTDIRRLYGEAYSTTQSLMAASHSELPGTIMFALAGLAVHDMEPVRLRYFGIEPDGSIRYLSEQELDERAKAIAEKGAKKKHSRHFWYEQTSAFANVEIQFRPRGDDKAPIRTYRHILANLDNAHDRADGRVLAHLEGKGKVAVMTKAASFLLWWDDFSEVRNYLLAHAAWMISDASGIPPRYAEPAGFEHVTFGDFAGPYFIQDPNGARKELVRMWAEQEHRDLPFRFGYPDQDKHNHMMVMRPRPNGQPRGARAGTP